MDEKDAFVQMAQDFPLRTCLFTFALPLVALGQLIHGLLTDGAILATTAFGLLVVAYTVVFTRYQVATYRRRQLVTDLDDGE